MRLETSIANCVLRPWQADDVANLIANANNRKVWRNLTESFPHTYNKRDAEQWIEIATDSGRSVHFAITLAGQAVGGVGAIAGQGIAERTAQFGYWLGDAYWGNGIATAVAAAFVNYLEGQRAFARLEAPVFAWNPASMRVLEKVGFHREGILRNSVSKDGELIDSVMYAYLIAA